MNWKTWYFIHGVQCFCPIISPHSQCMHSLSYKLTDATALPFRPKNFFVFKIMRETVANFQQLHLKKRRIQGGVSEIIVGDSNTIIKTCGVTKIMYALVMRIRQSVRKLPDFIFNRQLRLWLFLWNTFLPQQRPQLAINQIIYILILIIYLFRALVIAAVECIHSFQSPNRKSHIIFFFSPCLSDSSNIIKCHWTLPWIYSAPLQKPLLIN